MPQLCLVCFMVRPHIGRQPIVSCFVDLGGKCHHDCEQCEKQGFWEWNARVYICVESRLCDPLDTVADSPSVVEGGRSVAPMTLLSVFSARLYKKLRSIRP